MKDVGAAHFAECAAPFVHVDSEAIALIPYAFATPRPPWRKSGCPWRELLSKHPLKLEVPPKEY